MFYSDLHHPIAMILFLLSSALGISSFCKQAFQSTKWIWDVIGFHVQDATLLFTEKGSWRTHQKSELGV
jgi:hypothetical protein